MSNYISCIMVGILFGLWIGMLSDITSMQQQAVEHHAAQYTTDGSFEWLK